MKTYLVITALLFCIGQTLYAQSPMKTTPQAVLPKEIKLWPGAMPDDGGGSRNDEMVSAKGSVTQVSTPRLLVHRPEHPNGTAVLIISGGGYAHIELGKESNPTASWLQSEGITAFELVYRLPQENWKTTNVPFQDAQRAMRIIRSKADALGIQRIGVLGFSAGGHLAGIIATEPDHLFYTPVDAVDAISARPDFAALIYPVISMLPPNNKTHAKKSILGAQPIEAEEAAFSVEKLVDSHTPPTFLAQATDDPISPVANSYLMDEALKKANVAEELHIFPTGGHGWGLGKTGTPTVEWPQLFKAWAQRNGFWK